MNIYNCFYWIEKIQKKSLGTKRPSPGCEVRIGGEFDTELLSG